MIIKTKSGLLEGMDMDGYTAFYGVPYAKPPVGDLRWADPQPVDGWDGILPAKSFAHRSMQPSKNEGFYEREFRDEPAYVTAPDEDSLYLNIWTPARSGEERLPVAFWIHGGAYLGGCGHEKEFDGQAYCRRGVILVTINYRLGLWGFLAHPWLSAENAHKVSGNYGIKDQIMALQWVRDNIAAFGGDPDNITVFGQSAGAMSTQTLVSSPLTKGMIARAIMQSGGSYGEGLNRDDMTLKVQELYGEIFARMAGASDLEALRALPAQKLLELFEPFMNEVIPKSHGLFLVPVIDGYVLDAGYNTLIEQGSIADIPYMLGSTKDDILAAPEMKAMGEYPPLYKGTVAFSLKREETGHAPAWVYYFTRDLPGDDAGAFHSSELWYTFGTLERSWRPFEDHDYELSGQMLDYWVNFMKTGDPNGGGCEPWPPCSAQKPYVKAFL